ncbi:ImmA/IrrE family metallo-endopeptidase [Gluconobacter oxydans]|uniref:ImmA/IrrE family metallo-endopeptidase n=1 Tax=Gluconobacter oxydans TaxID=442 RepID=UPI0039ECB1A9
MKALAKTMMPNRRALADKAMKAAITARLKAGKDLVSPICIYSIAEAHGVRVTFNSINMEGMYQRGSPSRIHLSSLRPLARRAYNCAHELGHHLLGHGSSIDELRENQTSRPWDVPEEYSADTFAAYALMPTLGIRNAFAVRELAPETATPVEIYSIACQFGVGYSTLVTHLRWGEGMISQKRADALRRFTPRTLRAHILGSLTPQPLLVADDAWSGSAIDAEVGHLLLLPSDTIAHGEAVVAISDLPGGRLFEAKRPGLVRFDRPGSDWAVFGRIARAAYVGRAEFRHLEDDLDD